MQRVCLGVAIDEEITRHIFHLRPVLSVLVFLGCPDTHLVLSGIALTLVNAEAQQVVVAHLPEQFLVFARLLIF